MCLTDSVISTVLSCFDRDVRLLNTPKGSLEWTSGPFISRLLKGSIVIVLEIVSVVFILFVILWAFKLVIDSFDNKLLKFYWQYSEKGYETEIKNLEKELGLWWKKTQALESSGMEIPPEHRAEFTRIFRAIDILLQKKMAARLKQYRKGPRL